MLNANPNNNCSVLPDGNGGFTPCPELMTEEELIHFLRIDQISKAKNHKSAVAHLKRVHDLPCIHICHQPLYPREAVLKWIQERVQKEMIK